MYLSLLKNFFLRFWKLITTSGIVVSFMLILLLKQPFSRLFYLSDLNDYYFILSGLFSGLVTYTKVVYNQEIPSKNPLYLSIGTGAFVSLFFYQFGYRGLIDVLLIPGLNVGSFLVSLPGISGLHGLNSCKLSINKSSFNATRGFKHGLRTIFFGASGKKIPGGGFVSSSLDNSSSQKTTLYSEKARGKKAEISDCRHDPQESSSRGIKRKASDTNLKDSFNAKDFSVFSDRLYKDVTQISGSRVEDIFNKNKSHLALVRSITLGDLGINSNSREGKLIANFAENYKGDVPAVKQFCSAVLNPANPYYSNIVIYSIVEDIKTTSSAKGRKVLDAIHERTK